MLWTFYVRPQAASWQARQQALQAADAEYQPQRSFMAILKDPEQEVAIILGLWALGLAALKARALSAHRRQLDKGLLSVPAGYRILPGDVREYSHKLEDLPGKQRELIPVRTLRRALKRFGETANVQDAADSVHDYCESESARLDAELAVIRFCVWAIPAVGFVDTVRGIGNALAGAQLALRGDARKGIAGRSAHERHRAPRGAIEPGDRAAVPARRWLSVYRRRRDAGPHRHRAVSPAACRTDEGRVPAGAGAVPRGGVDPAGAGGAGRNECRRVWRGSHLTSADAGNPQRPIDERRPPDRF